MFINDQAKYKFNIHDKLDIQFYNIDNYLESS